MTIKWASMIKAVTICWAVTDNPDCYSPERTGKINPKNIFHLLLLLFTNVISHRPTPSF